MEHRPNPGIAALSPLSLDSLSDSPGPTAPPAFPQRAIAWAGSGRATLWQGCAGASLYSAGQRTSTLSTGRENVWSLSERMQRSTARPASHRIMIYVLRLQLHLRASLGIPPAEHLNLYLHPLTPFILDDRLLHLPYLDLILRPVTLAFPTYSPAWTSTERGHTYSCLVAAKPPRRRGATEIRDPPRCMLSCLFSSPLSSLCAVPFATIITNRRAEPGAE